MANQKEKTKILVIDDERLIRLTLNAKLRQIGYTAVCVASIPEAVVLLNDDGYKQFTAIITDIMMGDMDGFVFRDIVKGPDLEEKVGYYGERMVLKAQMLGLNTCWVAGTYNRFAVKYEKDANEKLACVISLGYGANQGVAHKNRIIGDLCETTTYMPKWFEQAMYAVMLAPSAMHQQHYKFKLYDGDIVEAVSTGGPYSAIDLGIAEYHFEIGAGDYPFTWKE